MKFSYFAVALALAVAFSGPIAFAQNQGSVVNATFTSNVVNGAPVDFRQQFTNLSPVVYYYGELLDLAGQPVKIRWSLESKRMQETVVEVTRMRQSAWSMMKMQPEWTGNWTVEVLDAKGRVVDLQTLAFNPPL